MHTFMDCHGRSKSYVYLLRCAYLQVIYDTLIEQSTPMEVVAVLAHELGHWANWDTSRQLLIAEVYPLTLVLISGLLICLLPYLLNFYRESKYVSSHSDS